MGKLCQRGHDTATAAIRQQAGIVVAMAPDVRRLDIDAIHDMRVASRRLRMAIKVFGPFLPKKPAKALRKQARRVTGLLGDRREFDVMGEMLREHRDETRDLWRRFMDHAIGIVDTRRAGQVESCIQAADLAESEDFRDVVERVVDGVDGANRCQRKLARKELESAHGAAHAAWRRWKASAEPNDLHRVRVKIKHLRYGCEFHRELYGEAMDAYIKAIKGAQGLLGEWNDCRLLEDMVLTLGNAADYSLAQGAPLVAEAYGNRAEELAKNFKPLGKELFGSGGKKAFEKRIKAQAVDCCPNPR